MHFKFKKDLFTKHHFWMLLLVYLPLVFAPLLLLKATVAAAIEKGRKGIETYKSTVAKRTLDPKNPEFIKLLKEKRALLQKQKIKVHQEAWQAAANIWTWPSFSRNPGLKKVLENAYVGDDIPATERREYADTLYKTQFFDKQPNSEDPLPVFSEMIKPAEFNDGWERIIRWMDTWQKPATVEECWLAQEDFWVQRELVSVIKAAMDHASRFTSLALFKKIEVSGKEAELPSGVTARQHYKTPQWQLDLHFQEKDRQLLLSQASTIKNINAAMRDLSPAGIELELRQRDAGGTVVSRAKIEIPETGPLAWGKSAPILAKPLQLAGFNLKEPIEIERIYARAQGELARLVLQNAHWELDLRFERLENRDVLSGRSTIRNINSAKRQLLLAGVELKLQQRDRGGRVQESLTVRPEGEPIPWDQAVEFKKPVPINLSLQEPLEIVQVLDWTRSPIKRIDRIELGGLANSHRASNWGLKSRKFETKGDEPPADPNALSPTEMPGPDGGGIPGAGPVPGAPNLDATPNGLIRNRYVDINPQVRRMPVGMVIIVDHAHIQDVLTAMVNAQIRMQIMQVHWQHVRGIRAPLPPVPEMTESEPVKPGVKPGAVTKPPTGPAVRTPFRGEEPFRSAGDPSAGMAEEDDPNLVELTLYALASLYERYPPKPEDPGANAGKPEDQSPRPLKP